MDPVSAIGLAAAIVQFIDIGAKVAKRLHSFSNDLDQVPKAFRQMSVNLPLVVDGLRRIKLQEDSDKLDEATRTALRPVVTECIRSTEELSGILDKTLPSATASSWERRKKALLSLGKDRKVEEISEALERYVQVLTFHQVISAGTSHPEAPPAYEKLTFWLVPLDRNASFVGREDILRQIDLTFQVKEGSQPKVALYGLGGIGKSQIALEYCYRRSKAEDKCSVFWVNAATAARFEESFKRIADSCGLVTGGQGSSDDITVLVKDYLETKHSRPWLMVLDNIDDKQAFFVEELRSGRTASDTIPRCSQGSLLFTTRTIDVAVDLVAPAEPIMVTAMTEEEGTQLVRNRLPGEKADASLIAEFLQELDHIPLAISQAVAFMAKRRKTVAQYLQQYRSNETARMRMLNYEFSDHGRQDRSLESVAKTWAISFDWIRNNDRRAIDLLYVISFLQHQSIPKELLLDADEDEFEFEDAVATLKGFSFLDANADDTVFKTHRLVQLTTRSWLQTQSLEALEAAAFEALKLLSLNFPEPITNPLEGYFITCANMLPHAELLLQYKFQKPLGREEELVKARLLDYIGRYVHWISDYQTGLARLREACRIKEKHLDERDVDRLRTQGRLVWSLFVNGDAEEIKAAMELGYRLLELRREVLGADHPETIDCLSDLAGVVEAAGDLEKSRTLQEEAVERSVRVLGPTHQDTLNCKAHLASVLQELDYIEQAVVLQREVYNVKLRELGPENPDLLAAEHNLAMILSDAGEDEEALRLTRQNFETKRRVLGVDHRETLITGHFLAVELRGLERDEECRRLCEMIIAEARQGPRRNNVHSIRIVNQISGLLDYLNNHAADTATQDVS